MLYSFVYSSISIFGYSIKLVALSFLHLERHTISSYTLHLSLPSSGENMAVFFASSIKINFRNLEGLR